MTTYKPTNALVSNDTDSYFQNLTATLAICRYDACNV